MDETCRGEVIEMRSRMWLASALCAALANLALTVPEPLASRMEELARTAETELAETIRRADAVLAPASSSAAA